MLTWINEKAKWVIVIFAAGIVVGLLAMDRVPRTAQSYPVGIVNDHKISYAEFDARIKNIVETQFQGQHLEDEQYTQLRSDVFRSFVRQIIMNGQYEKAGLAASVAEVKAEFKRNPDLVRSRVVQEAQYRLSAIQRQASSQEDMMQRSQNYIASLPRFLVDSTFNKADYDAWLETSDAFNNWGSMLQLESELETNTIPARQLQMLVSASVHPTALESKWTVERRMTDYDMDIAVAANSDFAVDENAVDEAMVKEYFNANPDSFFVENDKVKFQYVVLPIAATTGDDERIRDYAMTLYNQLTDSTSTTTFEDMARISSEDPGSAQNGGVLDQEAGRGTFVPEFEQAAMALDSGAISEPVKSQFGYHIIKSYGKTKDSTGAETAKVGHILLAVTASSETVDSLEQVLTSIKTAVNNGKSFADAAKEQNLDVVESEWMGRDGMVSALGYMKGLTSYAWPNKNLPEEEGPVSPVLKNNKFVAVAIKAGELKAGTRDLSLHFDAIKKTLLQKKASEAAVAYLNSVVDQVKAWAPAADSSAQAPAIEKVTVENKTASVDGYLPGFGYANPAVAKILASQKEGEWGPAIATEQGAVMVRINSKKAAEAEAVIAATQDDMANAARFTGMTLFNDYVSKLEAGTPVESNLDLFYKD